MPNKYLFFLNADGISLLTWIVFAVKYILKCRKCAYIFVTVLYSPITIGILIKKGRGLWPYEALTTCFFSLLKIEKERCQFHPV